MRCPDQPAQKELLYYINLCGKPATGPYSVPPTRSIMSKLDSLFAEALTRADARGVRRYLRPVVAASAGHIVRDKHPLVNFSSNDYLGLAHHPLLIERAQAWAAASGASAQASRLVCGTLELHTQVEAKLARFKGTEAALLFASGWQANASVLPALLQAAAHQGKPQVYTDRLNHASLHQGCLAAGIRQIRYAHNDLDHLERLLLSHAGQAGARFIITESVFSMDGDRSDVARLSALAARHNAFLYLDEAHATGVLGPAGKGLALGGVDLSMGTFSKALGGFGAYVAGSRILCDYLVNTCSGLIYTTALPPAVLGAMDAALDLVPGMEAERAHLCAASNRLRAALQSIGVDTGDSSTQIVPALVGETARTLEVSAMLERDGLLAIAIRPPTVPMGTSRLRIALSAAHTDDDLDRLIAGITHAWTQTAPSSR